MKSLFQNCKKNKSGFTLVEVVVVLVIIGILLTLVVPSLTVWIDKAKKKKLAAVCRTCVTAAQTIVYEEYVKNGKFAGIPKAADVEELAKIESGRVSNITVQDPALKENTATPLTDADKINANPVRLLVNTLTYTDENGDFIMYSRTREPDKFVSGPYVTWEKGDKYEVGQILSAKGFLFRCLVSHTSGSRSNTRNPTVKSNKGTWEVIGTDDGNPPAYNPTVRFGVGFVVTYKGNLYARTNYNLTGGQTPYSMSSSRYWELLGPDPDA